MATLNWNDGNGVWMGGGAQNAGHPVGYPGALVAANAVGGHAAGDSRQVGGYTSSPTATNGAGFVGNASIRMSGSTGGVPTITHVAGFKKPYPAGSSATLAEAHGCKCCGVGCAICDSCCADGPGVMTWVGEGRGDFSTETNYQYVGHGMGGYAVTRTQNKNFARCLGGLICVIALAALATLLIILCPSSTTTTNQAAEVILPDIPLPPVTTTTTPASTRKCEFWGDPHVISFDQAHLNFYGNGDHWIVKSKDLKIQGRFLGTKYTLGLAATNKVAIGGPVLGSHIIELGCLDCGPLLVDGTEVLEEFGYYKFPDLVGAAIRYDQHGVLPDPDQDEYEHRVIHVSLPNDVEVTIFRWKNYMDMRIVMSRSGDVDGACGNFDDDASDDTTIDVMRRVGVQIAATDSLFQKPLDDVPFSEPMKQMLSNQCEESKSIEARSDCKTLLPTPVSDNLLHNCMFNFCFGDMRHALKSARLYE